MPHTKCLPSSIDHIGHTLVQPAAKAWHRLLPAPLSLHDANLGMVVVNVPEGGKPGEEPSGSRDSVLKAISLLFPLLLMMHAHAPPWTFHGRLSDTIPFSALIPLLCLE